MAPIVVSPSDGIDKSNEAYTIFFLSLSWIRLHMVSRRHVLKMDPLAGMLVLLSTSLEVPFVILALELFFLECFTFLSLPPTLSGRTD